MSSEVRAASNPTGKVRPYVFSFAAVPTAIISAVLPSASTPPTVQIQSAPIYQYDAASAVGRDLDRRRILQGLERYRGMQTIRRIRRLRGRLVRRQVPRPVADSPDDIRAMLVDLG